MTRPTAKQIKNAMTGGPRLKTVISAAEYRNLVAKKPRANKFGAVKCERHGRVFDSIAEADRASSLLLLERAKVIQGLGFQPVFALRGENGKAVASLRADFAYFESGRQVVEDTKSSATLTPTARLKFKLFLQQYPHIELRLTDGKGRPVPYRLRYPREAA